MGGLAGGEEVRDEACGLDSEESGGGVGSAAGGGGGEEEGCNGGEGPKGLFGALMGE